MTWLLTIILISTGAAQSVPVPDQAKCESLAAAINLKNAGYTAYCKEQK